MVVPCRWLKNKEVQDCYHYDYHGTPTDGSAWTDGRDCFEFVVRGGSWDVGPPLLRSANRGIGILLSSANDRGFRVARTLTP
jgi:formylglycine-generating enzyme required for sulfatase activity